jgi:mono/diheme cytochrome c family protein
MKNLFLILSIFCFVVTGCKTAEKKAASPPPPALNCNGTAYTYESDIKPIMQENCTRCHNTNMKAGYNFNELSSVKEAAGNGYLLGTIKHQYGYTAMPAMAPQLDQKLIDKIECWIKTGMK